MDAKEASQIAKNYVIDVYRGEEIADVGLEEVEFDHHTSLWKITVGFSRPWYSKNPVTTAVGGWRPERSYKVVCIDKGGNVISLRDRLLPTPTG